MVLSGSKETEGSSLGIDLVRGSEGGNKVALVERAGGIRSVFFG